MATGSDNRSVMKDLYLKLCDIGCCKLCALRFLGETQCGAYMDVQKTLIAVS